MKRIDFIKGGLLLGLSSCIEDEIINDVEKMRVRDLAYIFGGGTAANVSSNFDLLNLQSDSASNFILNGSTVSQWTDLSPSDNHAVQAISGNQPLYNSGAITFDGSNDFLSFTEFNTNTYSVYYVIKIDSSTLFSTSNILAGAETYNTYISPSNRLLTVSNVSAGGGNRSYYLWGNEYYQVISVRRNTNTSLTIKCNGRELIYTSGALNSVDQYFKYVGKSSGASPFKGIIRAMCVSSECLSDEVDDEVLDYLFTKYNLPETSNAIVGFGDSITEGAGASSQFTTAWLPLLGTAKSRPIKNFGISGSPISNVAGFSTAGQTRYTTQLIEEPYSDTVCILYGTNDITFGYTATNFENALNAVVGGLITAGYAANKIVISTVPYQIGDANAAAIALYNAKIPSVVAANPGILSVDVYTPMKAYGDGCMADSKHPNDIGHDIIADQFIAVL